ncbi:MAG TPA: DUF4149 domain-containing protein [Pyrinomonadaceae bacterium]|nr:DUF4149 domain-containing protein [Pyrinomonadaceae bacterium]
MDLLHKLRMLLLAAWLGTAIYFSAVVAPSAFGVLRSFGLPNSGEIAGTIVTRTLSVVNTGGFLLSLLLLITAFPLKKVFRRWSFMLQLLLLTVVAAATATGEWVIAARMRSLRVAMRGQIDQVMLSDPNRIAFAVLHGYSVAALGIAMTAALLVILLMVLSRETQSQSPAK